MELDYPRALYFGFPLFLNKLQERGASVVGLDVFVLALLGTALSQTCLERGASVVGLGVFVRALSALAPRQRGCVRPFTHILFLPASGRSRVVFQLEQDILYLRAGQKRKDAVLTVKNADFVNEITQFICFDVRPILSDNA